MLQAKPDLSWRDVQHILIETAEKNDCSENNCDDDWAANGAGYHINHKYGFGRVDATAAVTTALDWTPLTDRGLLEVEEVNIGSEVGNFENEHGVSNTIPMGIFEGNLRVDFVEVIFTAPDHDQWTDLEITLASPSETTSVLAEPHDPPISGKFSVWKFGSVRHFGESSSGDWTLTVKDLRKGNGQNGLKGFSWAIKIYGTRLPTWNVTTPGSSVAMQPADEEDSDLTFFVDVTEPETEPNEYHAGTYWFPNRLDEEEETHLKITTELVPQRSWFGLPDVISEEITRPCADGPSADEHTAVSADWAIEYYKSTDWQGDQQIRQCHFAVLINGTPVARSVLAAPAGGDCQIQVPFPWSGTLTETLTTTWQEVVSAYQEEGEWVAAATQSGGVAWEYDGHCRTDLFLASIRPLWQSEGLWGSGWLYYYGCYAREPWPPAPPEPESFCPPPEVLDDFRTIV